MKKILLILAAVLLACSLTGCSSSAGDSAQTADAVGSEASGEESLKEKSEPSKGSGDPAEASEGSSDSSEDIAEAADVSEECPLTRVSFFGTSYGLPLSLEKLEQDGIEVNVVYETSVDADDIIQIYLSKDEENIKVYAYNPTAGALSYDAPELVIRKIIIQYADSYTGCAEYPSCAIEGYGIGSYISGLEDLLGEPADGGQLDDIFSEMYWKWDVNGETVSLDVTVAQEACYAIQVILPTK